MGARNIVSGKRAHSTCVAITMWLGEDEFEISVKSLSFLTTSMEAPYFTDGESHGLNCVRYSLSRERARWDKGIAKIVTVVQGNSCV